ncbi:hypothetical protein NC651_031232 [Populus alba x Populus x berolinensis]|uniref:Uncharacterized protein n=1 Tax=Populus alba x Populus x berolinensis TaxID=444605 RepID=A0AAD6LQS9_9ROSI|nr:hypothetical protein NC651_031084 [Populus alba x Populus x berolinensis]KAJ6872061.1 hypothetical protein NC651_031232 [Populus alba x Populus x berolinensis]KAJ6971580.1 hypothetical protein NC653_032179 [Populus alba x Populus x berolinensis]
MVADQLSSQKIERARKSTRKSEEIRSKRISKELWWNASRQARPLLLLSPDSKAKAIWHRTAMHHLFV